MKDREGREPPNKKSIVLEATPSLAKEEESKDEGEEEDFTMLIRKVDKILYKKGRMSNSQRTRQHMKNEKMKERRDGSIFLLQEDGTFDSGFSLSPNDHI